MSAETSMREDQAILLIDDSPDVREAIAELLVAAGYRVETAADGQAALDRLREGFTPRVILLDWLMPGMDGRAFRQRQVADPGLKGIPVVVFTADGRANEKARALGVRDAIRKPPDIDAMLAIVARYCSDPTDPRPPLALGLPQAS